MSDLVIADVDVRGRRVDVVVERGQITVVAPDGGRGRRGEVLDGHGGALLPGLHDHHVHLLALAAARASLDLGDPTIRTRADVATALRARDHALTAGAWLRAVRYHEGGDVLLDRTELDRIVPTRPVRVQHRGGALWILNSAAFDAIALDTMAAPAVERDASGRVTGRIFGGDEFLRDRVPADPPDLARVGAELAAMGVTGVTDATPTVRPGDVELIAAAVGTGALPLDVMVTGALELDASAGRELARGPVKLMLSDHALPSLDEFAAAVRAAHARARPVAVHSVTAASLVLALAAFDEAGARAGDRIEHGAVIPRGIEPRLAALGLTVVTQPNFVAERGDDYLAEVDVVDRDDLWPCRRLIDAGVLVAAGTDAPFGDPDPWRAIAAAATRRTRGGAVLGRDEVVAASRALDLFLGPLDAPGGTPRQVAVGAPANLCLLRVPLADALRDPARELVAATIRRGAAMAGFGGGSGTERPH